MTGNHLERAYKLDSGAANVSEDFKLVLENIENWWVPPPSSTH